MKNKKPIIIGAIAAVAVIALIAIIVAVTGKQKEQTAGATSGQVASSVASSSLESSSASASSSAAVVEDYSMTPAFPGAEGGGKYATGGRGGDVYVVTNLEDEGEGSLRYGIQTAPREGRIIVFDVGGTIHLKSTLSFKNKQNITIAGQTAPGDGITIAGYDTNISDSENVVIRFVRFRVGTENLLNGGDSMDALWGRDNDTFMIDHCSFSWSTDETLSTYRGKNGTVQWCLVSESLTVSGHSKGRHGYGGIWGGDNTVFQYNLLTNHTSRNPRVGGGTMADPASSPSYATLQISNNVLYNHGYYACYGGGFAYTNYLNNYVKPGYGTRDSIYDALIHVGESGKDGGFYIDGNILEGNDVVTGNNTKGIREDESGYIVSAPYEAEAFESVTLVDAQSCYEPVLNGAGATYPRRDAVDARLVAQLATNTGSYINTPDEVGGYPCTEAVREAGFDTDHDGIPDAWETAHGLDPKDATDSVKIANATDTTKPDYGYAWIELYINELVEEVVAEGYKAANPTVSTDLADNTLVEEGKTVTVVANATANNGGSISKVEFYNGSEVVATDEEAPYSYDYEGLEDGTYHISVRAYDNAGNATQSDASRLHINSTAGTGDWTGADVGKPGIVGTASLEDGVLTMKSAGKLGQSEGSVSGTEAGDPSTDNFHFVYQEIKGDVELVTKLDSYLAVDNHTFNGIMFRESLDADAATAALGLTMTKIWDGNLHTWTAFMVNRPEKGGNMTVIGSKLDAAASAEEAGIPIISNLKFKEGNTFNGVWLKLSRNGDVFTGAVSEDKENWVSVGSFTVKLPETAYVGFAVDAGKAANDLENYATAKFSDIKTNTEFGKATYNTEHLIVRGAEYFSLGDNLTITLSKEEGYLLPDSVEVKCNGKKANFTYDKDAGVIFVEKPTGDLAITAIGVEREVKAVEFEEIDEGDFLTVEEKDGKLILTHTSDSGKVASSTEIPAENESWIVFPETNEFHEMSLKIKVTATTDAGNKSGVFVGVFNMENYAFNTLGFRNIDKLSEGVSPYWMKGPIKVGNGSPKTAFVMNEEYSVTFSYTPEGLHKLTWIDTTGKENTKIFKSHEGVIQKGDMIRYGIGLIGATAEVSELKLVDCEGNVIYEQK